MPEQRQDDTARRFGPPPGVTLYVPVVVAFLVQVPATVAVSLWMHVAPRWVLLGTVLAAASALALLAARALPGPTVAAVAAFTVADLFVPPDAGPPFIALAFAIVGAVVRGALGWALGAVGSAWLVAVVASGMSGHLWHPFRIALTTLLIGLCFAIGVGLRTRLDRAARRRAQIVERRRASEQEERTRIARELHDVLAHSLSQIAVQSGAGLHLFDREPERAREALANIRGLAATGLDEVRSVLAILRGDGADASGAAPLTPQPQLAQLAPLVAERTGHGLEVTLEDRLDGHLPRSSVQTTAYRIVQEALTNVVRHSEAAHAVVRLHRDGDRLVVVVDDDGTGTGAGAGAEGGGMRGMRERAGLLGGTVEVQPGPDGGTRVRADLPWEGSA